MDTKRISTLNGSGSEPARVEAAEAPAVPAGLLAVYRVEDMLGAGAMGVVYRATHLGLRRQVALKLPKLSGPEQVARFVREGRILAGLQHANLVRVYDAGEVEGCAYIALEFIQGATLAALAGGRALPVEVAVWLTVQLLEGLGHAHEHGVLHRDVKSENVLVTAEGVLKLADFGLARSESEGARTRLGTIMGTPGYMSPEQAMGEAVDARADIYSAGIVLFELLAGRLPFVAEKLGDLLEMQIHQPPPPLALLVPGMPEGLAEVVDCSLAKTREERFATAGIFVRRLRRIVVEDEFDKAAGRLPELVARAGKGGQVIAGTSFLRDVSPTTGKAASRTRLATAANGKTAISAVSNRRTSRTTVTTTSKRSQPVPGVERNQSLTRIRTVGVLALVGAFISVCAGIAWHLRPSGARQPLLSAETIKPLVPSVAPPPPLSRKSPELPTRPIVIELPDALIAFGRGKAPAVRREPGARGPRIAVGGGIWQATMNSEFPATTPERNAIAGLLPKKNDAVVIFLSARPTQRFGDELNMRDVSIEGEFYPHIRANVSQRLGLGRGRIVTPDAPSDDLVKTLVGEAKGPPWLELQVALAATPAALSSFQTRLAAALRKMEPALEYVTIGRDINTDGWREGPEKFAALVEPVRKLVGAIFPSVWIGPGSLALPTGQAEPIPLEVTAGTLKAFVKLPVFRGAPRFELHVADIGGRWLEGLAVARKAAAAAGLGQVPFDLYLQRLPKISSRYAARSFAGDDIEMRELLRAMTRGVAAGVRRITFGALRETLQGPFVIDVFAASVGGKVVENEGSGARAFRYMTSRLAEAKPSKQPLSAGVQGVALELPDRRVWFLWAPDGAHRWVQIPADSAAALAVRVCPVAAWNATREPPIQVLPAREGLLAVDIDDGLTAIEELPRITAPMN